MNHLKEVGMTYFDHLSLASLNALKLFLSSMSLLIHGWLPFLFTKTTSRLIDEVQQSFPKAKMNKEDRILVRFNTKWKEDPDGRQWRVLVNDKETLVHSVSIYTPGQTIEENIDGEQKFHILCFGSVWWDERKYNGICMNTGRHTEYVKMHAEII